MKLYVKNIGKITEAKVEIKGITVIGGENNTGKSTVGKSLFSMFNSFYAIQQQIREERLLSIENVLRLIYRNFYFYDSEQIKDIDDFSKEILSKADEYRKKPELLKKEILSMFNVTSDKESFFKRTNFEDVADRIIDILNISDEDIFNSVVNKKINAEFNGQLLNIYSESEGIISLSVRDQELSVKAVEDTISVSRSDYSLHTEAIYIDDPFVLDNVDFRRIRRRIIYADHRDQLINKLLSRRNNASVVDEIVVENRFKKIYEKLITVCDGSIVQQKNGRLAYQMKNSDRALSVKNLSTGLKTFITLKTLLTNGTIETNGTIILDEPEIHLHPEWQLLFAEIIVLLNKEFGVNILLNTHSPYFLRAIQVYSAKYEMSDVCRYYMSEIDETGKIFINDVTDNVDKIFAKLSKPLQKLEDERWNIDTF
jgi:hypothetical protein